MWYIFRDERPIFCIYESSEILAFFLLGHPVFLAGLAHRPHAA